MLLQIQKVPKNYHPPSFPSHSFSFKSKQSSHLKGDDVGGLWRKHFKIGFKHKGDRRGKQQEELESKGGQISKRPQSTRNLLTKGGAVVGRTFSVRHFA